MPATAPRKQTESSSIRSNLDDDIRQDVATAVWMTAAVIVPALVVVALLL